MNHLDLYTLFDQCLNAEYTTVSNGTDIAFKRDGDNLYIFFEKSDGLRDWINNLSFCVLPYGDMEHPWRCHGGFLRVMKSTREAINEALSEKNIRSVTLVGYSHGAALAVLAHEYIWFNYPNLRTEITGYGFGCPRVLFGKIPKCVLNRWSNFYRISYRGDLITHLPPALFGFRHIGSAVRIGKPMLSGIDAHRPESYLKALKRSALSE